MKKLLKKSLAFILALTMVFSAAPLAGLVGLELQEFNLFGTKAEAAETSGYYTYTVYIGEATITKVDTSISGSITIPSTLDGRYSVTKIGSSAFEDCSGLTSVTIGGLISNIGDHAFDNCTGLTSVTIGESVSKIGHNAFYDCKNLKRITVVNDNSHYSSDEFGVLYDKNKTKLVCCPEGSDRTEYIIPNSVTSLEDYAFYNCTELTSVTLPEGLTSISFAAFYGCLGLSHLIIPDGVTSIGDWAFYKCTNLTSITIPNSITSIGGYSFELCTSLTSIEIPDSVLNIRMFAFCRCSSITNVIIPDGITSIDMALFYGCIKLTSITIPDSVTSIGDFAFLDCTSLVDVYYSGTEEQWNAISIGNDNDILVDVDIHYNSGSGGESPDNPGSGDEDPETPTDRTAYHGILENYVTTVELNGSESYVSEIIVNGKQYPIKKDIISISQAEYYKNKDVAFVVKDDEVIFILSIEDCALKPVVGISGDEVLGYSYLGNNSFNKDSITLELNIYNSLSIPAIAPPGQTEEHKKNLAAIGSLEDMKAYVSSVEVYISDSSDAFSFSGNKRIQIPINEYVSAGGSLKKTVTANVNLNFEPEEYQDKTYFTCKMTFGEGGSTGTSESAHCVTITNYNLAPSKPSNPSNPTGNDEQLAIKAAYELNKVQYSKNQGAISLMGSPDLVGLIGFDNIKAIEEKLFAIVCLTHIPKEKIQETLSDKVISKVFGAKKWFCLNTSEIQVKVAVKTDKYGEIIVKLTSEYPEYNVKGYNLGGLGQVYYELSGKGAKKLPDNIPKSGFAGFFTSVDVTAFCNLVYDFVESELKKSYDLAYGNDANKAVDFIFGKSVNKILSHTKYGSASGLYWEYLTIAAKEYKIECPVDVFVYDSAGNLVASIENNVETLSCENVEIEINGDTKYVRLFDDSYKIVYKATANGSMRVTVNEMANLDTSLRTVVIDDIPLSAGVSYTQNSDEKILEDSNYALTANDGTVYNPDSDTVNFHDHVSNGVWFDGDASTCTEKGWKCSICTVCNEWFKEYLDMVEHSDNDGNGYCDDCGVITAVSGFAIRNPSTATINYGDSIILHADIDGMVPAGARIEWTASNGNFDMSVSADGSTCKISPKSSGDTTFTAKVIDGEGKEISSDTQQMTAKAGLWQKIVAFFKKIFGLTKTIPEAFKGIF